MEKESGVRAFVLQLDNFRVRRGLLTPSPSLSYPHTRTRTRTGGAEEEEEEEEDDYYDADSVSAYDTLLFKRVLQYAKRKGRVPAPYCSAQDGNTERGLALGLSGLGVEVRQDLSTILAQSGVLANARAVVVVDGALLYADPQIRDLLDIRLFLRTSKGTALSRRFSRFEDAGTCVDRECFWRTRSYFEDPVWRNYVREYAPLFEEGDVEGEPERRICDGLRVRVQPRLDLGVGDTLRWGVGVVVRDGGEVDERVGKRDVGEVGEEDRNSVLGKGFVWLEWVRRKLYDWV